MTTHTDFHITDHGPDAPYRYTLQVKKGETVKFRDGIQLYKYVTAFLADLLRINRTTIN